MNGQYILKDGNAVEEPDLMTWGKWFQDADRHVALDTFPWGKVSTVFLGLDHSFRDGGPPILWETMVFGGPRDGEQERYATLEEAQEGHRRIVTELDQEGRNHANSEAEATE